MSTNLKAHLLLTFTVICWAINFIGVKVVFHSAPPAGVALMRLIFVSVFFVVVALLRKEPLKYPPGLAPRILLQGFLAFGIYMILFLEGLNQTSPGTAAIIMAAAPILTAILSVVLKYEKFRPGLFVGAIFAFAGVGITMFFANAKESTMLGSLLVLVSACVWAVSVNVLKPILKEVSPFRAMTLSLPGAFCALLPYGIVSLSHFQWQTMTPVWWLWFFHIAIMSSGFAFVTYYAGIHLLGTGRAVMYHYFVPPLTVILSYLILGSPMHWQQWAGMLVIIGGVAYALSQPAPKSA